MADIEQQKLDAELAKISIVKSAEFTELARNNSELVKFQNAIADASSHAEMVQDIIGDLEPHQITPELAVYCDKVLTNSDVPIIPKDSPIALESAGCEALGFTLMPDQYKALRTGAIKEFLGDAVGATVKLMRNFSANMKDQYLLMTESLASLEKRIALLEEQLDSKPTIKYGSGEVVLGYRLFNMFRVNGKVDESWYKRFNQVLTALRGMSQGYCKVYSDSLNDTFAYFGGFEGLDESEALVRLNAITDYVKTIKFKDCTLPARELSDGKLRVNKSVTIMGEYYFVNSYNGKGYLPCYAPEDVNDFIQQIVKDNVVTFTSDKEVDYGKTPTVKNLGTFEIKALIKLMNSAIVEITKIHNEFNRYDVSSSEYVGIVKALSRSNLGGLEDTIIRNFETLILNRHNQFAIVRGNVTNYLILLLNGLIEFCNMSIESGYIEE